MGFYFKDERIVFFYNKSVCEIVSTGKSKSQPFQDCLTEICNLAAISQYEIKAQHLTSGENGISDILSR